MIRSQLYDAARPSVSDGPGNERYSGSFPSQRGDSPLQGVPVLTLPPERADWIAYAELRPAFSANLLHPMEAVRRSKSLRVCLCLFD